MKQVQQTGSHARPTQRRYAWQIAWPAGALALAVLGGCATPPQGAPGQIISRLPADAAPAAQLSPTEKARYQQIDKQVMSEQNARDQAPAWVDVPAYYGGYTYGYSYYTPYPGYPAYAVAPAYYPAYPTYYPTYPLYPAGYGPGW